MQIIGVGHDEREEKAERVYPNFGQTDGLQFVIGAENKKSQDTHAPTGVILQYYYTIGSYYEQTVRCRIESVGFKIV